MYLNVYLYHIHLAPVRFLQVIDRGFERWSGQTKDNKIGICCFSAKHTTLKRKSKDWLTRNQNNVSMWGDMSTCRLLFQSASTIKNPAMHGSLVQSASPHLIELD